MATHFVRALEYPPAPALKQRQRRRRSNTITPKDRYWLSQPRPSTWLNNAHPLYKPFRRLKGYIETGRSDLARKLLMALNVGDRKFVAQCVGVALDLDDRPLL